MIKAILITKDPVLAAEAERAGVARIMVDLESMGKKERQSSRQTYLSDHKKEDIAAVRAAITKAELVVRVNPWHKDSAAEIEYVVGKGADLVILPMITSLSQFDKFLGLLKGRAKPLPLVETGFSMAHISHIIAAPQVEEVYIGFNDLHLSLGLDLLFEPLSLGLVDWMTDRIRGAHKAFGFGGVGAVHGGGELPPERLLGEHARLGSTCVILSSRFHKDVELSEKEGREERLLKAMTEIQHVYHTMQKRSKAQAERDMRDTFAVIKKIADGKRS